MNTSHHRLRLSSCSFLLGLCCGAFATSATAQSLSSQEKLTAIRKELVQAALDAPTQVQATQWIDAQGVLRESSSFRSGMQIRGLKVLSYGYDEQGEPSAKVEWKIPPPQAAAATLAVASTAQQPPNCKPHGPGLHQHVVALSWTTGTGWNADQIPLLVDLKTIFRTNWHRSSSSSGLWRLTETGAEIDASNYYQALLASGNNDIPWHLNLALEFVRTANSTPKQVTASIPSYENVQQFELGPKPPSLKLQLQLTLTSRQQNRPVIQRSALLELDAQLSNWEPARLDQAARHQVSQQALNWAQEIQGILACLPVLAQVTQATPTHIRINVGTQAGVRVGDEWLLADSQNIPLRLLEADVASHTVLAKVQFIDKYQAQLQIQAGAPRMVQRNWTAWAAQESH